MAAGGDSDIEILNDNVSANDIDNEIEIVPNPPPKPIMDLSSTQNDILTQIDYPSHSQSVVKSVTCNKRKIKFEQETESNKPPKKKQRVCESTDNKNVKQEKLRNSESIRQKKTKLNSEQLNSFKITSQHIGKVVKNPKSTLHFWSVYHGLNYWGKCLNSKCVAYTEPISVKGGFGIIEPIKEFDNGIIKCPGCSMIFDLRKIAIYKAKANVEYQRMNDTEITTKQVSVKNGDIYKFGEGNLKRGLDVKKRSQPLISRPALNLDINVSSNVRVVNTNTYRLLRFDVTRHRR